MKKYALFMLIFGVMFNITSNATDGAGFLNPTYRGTIKTPTEFVSIMTKVINEDKATIEGYLRNTKNFSFYDVRNTFMQQFTAVYAQRNPGSGKDPLDKTKWVTKIEAIEMLGKFQYMTIDKSFWSSYRSVFIEPTGSLNSWVPVDEKTKQIREGDIIAVYEGIPVLDLFCFNPLVPFRTTTPNVKFDGFDEKKPDAVVDYKTFSPSQGAVNSNYNSITIITGTGSQPQVQTAAIVPQYQPQQQVVYQQPQQQLLQVAQPTVYQQPMMMYQQPPQQQVIVQKPGIGGYLLAGLGGYVLGRLTDNNQHNHGGYYTGGYNYPTQTYYPNNWPQNQYPDFQGPTMGGVGGNYGNTYGSTTGNQQYGNQWGNIVANTTGNPYGQVSSFVAQAVSSERVGYRTY